MGLRSIKAVLPVVLGNAGKTQVFTNLVGNTVFFMPQTSKNLRGILLLGCACVRPSVMLFDACHILWTVHARVLKYHIWIPHGKIAYPYYFFLIRVISLSGVIPFEKIRMCIWARDLKLGQLIEYLINFWINSVNFFQSYGLCKFGHFNFVS